MLDIFIKRGNLDTETDAHMAACHVKMKEEIGVILP